MAEVYGQYELLEPFAAGGMAEVWLARRLGVEGFAREVVVKRMLPRLAVDPECVKMFLDEARITAVLQHPNIAQVLDLGRLEETYFIAMEFVDGPHLGALLKKSIVERTHMPADLCAWIVARAAEGLHHAHEQGDPITGDPLDIVHRDVNHANILVSRFGAVKVTDFGIARATTQTTKTRVGALKGKLGYIAPEQCLAEPFDRRADVWALGVVLFELLTRRRLYHEKSDLETLDRIVYEPYFPASSRNRQIDAGMDALLEAALQKSPAYRTKDAAAFAQQVDRWLEERGSRANRATLADWVSKNARDICPSARLPRLRRPSGGFIKSEQQVSSPTAARVPPAGLDDDTTQVNAVAFPAGAGTTPHAQTRAHNLTRHRNLFVGHEQTLSLVGRHFDNGARLVTLYGLGGIGKSRVANRYACDVLDDYMADGGVWQCSFGEIDGVEAACTTLAGVLGVPLPGAHTSDAAVEQLGQAIAARGRVLIVLDDFDLLARRVDRLLNPWLRLAPDARFLVTARSLLRGPDEIPVEVRPLKVPAPGQDPAEFDSVKLFVERARAVRPSFSLTRRVAGTVASIVRTLDGIPLAIELAAARIAVLAPDRLLRRLERRFDVLQSAGRELTGRRGTLRGAIEFSWNLLPPAEQAALHQATAFRGGFSLEAAEGVIDLSAHDDAPWVMDVVQSLREKSMLRADEVEQTDGELRFGLFHSIRAWAREQVDDAGAVDAARERHARWYLEEGERWLAELPTHDGVEARRAMAADLDNLLAVHERALAAEPPSAEIIERAARIAILLTPLLVERGPISTLTRVVEEALRPTTELAIDPTVLGWAVSSRSEVRARTGRARQAIPDAERAIELARSANDPELESFTLYRLSFARRLTSDLDGAMAAGLESRRIAQGIGHLHIEARAMNHIGCIHYDRGDLDAATRSFRAAVAASRQIGHFLLGAMSLGNVGLIQLDQGQLDQAETTTHEALVDARRLDNRRGIGAELCRLARIEQERGQVDRSRKLWQRSVSMLSAVGDRYTGGYAEGALGLFHLELGEPEKAESPLRTATAALESMGDRRYGPMYTAALAYLSATRGDFRSAEADLKHAAEWAGKGDDPSVSATIDLLRAAVEGVQASQSPPDRAKALLESARQRIAKASNASPDGRPAATTLSADVRVALRIAAAKV